MSHPDDALWRQCWRDGDTAFHQAAINPLLQRHWPSLALPTGCAVFVPLCGRSRDMHWLAAQGHAVIGVELSPLAVRDYFRKQRQTPKRTSLGALTLWQHGKTRIYCGDFFDLRAEHLGDIRAVYDRAALTALPETLRAEYVRHLRTLLPDDAPIFLLTAEDPEEEAGTPQVSQEIIDLYAAHFTIELADVECGPDAGTQGPGGDADIVEHRLYHLRPAPGGRGRV